jgi:dolichyl-phosphate-mannose--protein O-mannosyl transferase
MLYVVTIVSEHCKKMEHSYKKHPRDHENKNVMSIHRSKYMNVILLGCLVTITFCLPLNFYYSLPLPPQTFRSLCLCHSGWSMSSAGKCVDNQTW